MKTISKTLAIFIISLGAFSCGGEQNEAPNNNAPEENVVIEEPQKEPVTVEDYIQLIHSDAEWMKKIEEKAAERGVSLDEMVRMDAEWMANQKKKDAPKTVESVIQSIKNNPEWLKQVEGKAQERNISLDEMLVIEAEYVVAQQNKTE